MDEAKLRELLREQVPHVADGRIVVVEAGFDRSRGFAVVRATVPGLDAVEVIKLHLRGDAIDVIPFAEPRGPGTNER